MSNSSLVWLALACALNCGGEKKSQPAEDESPEAKQLRPFAKKLFEGAGTFHRNRNKSDAAVPAQSVDVARVNCCTPGKQPGCVKLADVVSGTNPARTALNFSADDKRSGTTAAPTLTLRQRLEKRGCLGLTGTEMKTYGWTVRK